MPSGNALGHAALGAKRDSGSKKLKSSSTDSDSEDSDVALNGSDVFYHRFGNGIPGHTTRAPPYTRG